MIDQTKSSEQRAREAARALANAVNEMGFDAKSFADELCKQHRTLQQNAFRACGAFLLQLSTTLYDLRNEHAVRASSAITEQFGDMLRAVPHV